MCVACVGAEGLHWTCITLYIGPEGYYTLYINWVLYCTLDLEEYYII